MNELVEPLNRLLNERYVRLDRFDADYIDDFHLIMRENYKISNCKKGINNDFDKICEIITNKYSKNFDENVTIEEISEILKNEISDRSLFKPKITPKNEHTKYNYHTIKNWDNIKDNKDVETINEIQSKYSLRQGANGSGGKTCFAIRFSTEKHTLFNSFNSSSHILSIGCRWVDEIKYIRQEFNLPNTIGLDLFSDNEDYVKVGDIHKAPFDDNTFDFIYKKNKFNKLYDLRKALDECVRILKPGGFLVTDDCLDYTIGVNPVARSNVTSNKWFIMYLQDNIDSVVLDIENPATPSADRVWRKKEGLLVIKIKK